MHRTLSNLIRRVGGTFHGREVVTDSSVRVKSSVAELMVRSIAYRRAGEIQKLLGNHQASLAYFEQAILLLDEKDDRSRSLVFQRELARAWFGQGSSQWELGQREQAEQSLVRAHTVQENLVQSASEPVETRYDLANTCNRLGRLYQGDSRRALAEQPLRQAIRLLSDLLRDAPDRLDYADTLLNSINNLATVLRDLGQNDEAGRTFERGIQLAQSLAEDSKLDGRLRYSAALLEANFAMFLRRIGDTARGADALRRGISAIEQLARDFPHVPRYRFGVYKFHINLGAVALSTKAYEEGEPHLKKALEVMEQLAADYPAVVEYQTALGGALNDISALRIEQKDFGSARQYLARAIAAQRKALDLDVNSTAACKFLNNHIQNQVVALEGSTGPDSEVDQALQQALSAARWLAQFHAKDADNHFALGVCLQFQAARFQGRGELTAARKSIDEAVRHLEEAGRLDAASREISDRLTTVRQYMAELLERP